MATKCAPVSVVGNGYGCYTMGKEVTALRRLSGLIGRMLLKDSFQSIGFVKTIVKTVGYTTFTNLAY